MEQNKGIEMSLRVNTKIRLGKILYELRINLCGVERAWATLTKAMDQSLAKLLLRTKGF